MVKVTKLAMSFGMRVKPILISMLGFLLIFLQLALGLIFIYSGVEKVTHPQQFLATVYDFRLTGPLLGMAVAIFLPWFELLLGLAILIGVYPGGTLSAASFLGAMFLVVQASAIVRGLSVSCGCFGPDEAHMVGKATFLRTSLIFLATVAVWFWHYFQATPHPKKLVQKPVEEFSPIIKVRQYTRQEG